MAPIVFIESMKTIIEWYDFLIYGTVPALAFHILFFFQNFDSSTGTLAALGTYTVGF
jgi:MHS family shikimate/dehydroshikimate transporter-like MFS transporter